MIDVEYNAEQIQAAIEHQIARGPLAKDYKFGDGNASSKIVKILKEETTAIQKQNTY